VARPDAVVSLAGKLAAFSDRWSPRIVGQMNDLHIKLAKVEGEFVWHDHEDTDEFFLVLSGELTIQMEGAPDVQLGSGEFFIVPRGVRHRPVAEAECEILLLEPAGTVNTGDAEGSGPTASEQWI
jgi:mannose-6-phosphate isomerase-like protein (cupin superfamily)